ncbi:transglycosylase SLT domain-containing protein [Streptomyces sp. NPDC012769]|uniref:transglycosylase SLT domain-containing protein n=1 Tax=Streptomyces sp. NPDC012769 TaxID=3364848 RepID=UPI00369C774D
MVDNFTPQFNTFLNELNNITSKGNYTEQPKLNPVKPRTLNVGMPGLIGTTTTSGSSDIDKLMRAIRSQESSDNYRAVNRDSGALGGYQVMPFNLFGGSEWDRKALGRDVTRDEFLNNPGLQDQIARWQLSNYLRKYGAAGAAVAWYGGEGSVKNMYSTKTQTGGYPSLYAYWTSVLNRM